MFESVALRVEEPIETAIDERAAAIDERGRAGSLSDARAGALGRARADPLGGAGADSRAEVLRELQGRIRAMQRTTLDSRALPTHDALADLLPGGALQVGGAYAVAGSTSLALALLQGPSAAGAWCAVVGVPDLGVEAAAGLGVDLERLVLVPHPGEHWAAVVSALIDVVSVVLVAPPAPGAAGPRATPALTQRIGTRLRSREAALVALLPGVAGAAGAAVADWPGAVARLRVTRSDWAGLGSGFGHLQGRQVTVASASESWPGREKARRLWLPGPDQRIAAVEARPGARAGENTGTERVETARRLGSLATVG